MIGQKRIPIGNQYLITIHGGRFLYGAYYNMYHNAQSVNSVGQFYGTNVKSCLISILLAAVKYVLCMYSFSIP